MTSSTRPHPPVERQLLHADVRRDADGTEVEELEWYAEAGWSALPSHRHAGVERYEVVHGRVRVVVDGAGRTYRTGESVIVDAEQIHTLEPVDGHGAHLRVQRWLRPGAPTPEPGPRTPSPPH